PLAYFDANPVGRLITRVTSDVDAINQFITGGLISMITSTFLIIVYMGVPLAYFDANPVGRLITRVTSDVDAINQFITGGL
ncbi:hypothetical protein CTI14_67835, partial [Methylobacterium radiotolerans]